MFLLQEIEEIFFEKKNIIIIFALKLIIWLYFLFFLEKVWQIFYISQILKRKPLDKTKQIELLLSFDT
jgi:hypothetical protein